MFHVKPYVTSSILGSACINHWDCYIFLTMCKNYHVYVFLETMTNFLGGFHGFLEGFWPASRIFCFLVVIYDTCIL
jgi:hypothetical protein